MPWVTDQNGNQVWQGSPTDPVTAPLTNPNPTQQPINYPPPVTLAPATAPASTDTTTPAPATTPTTTNPTGSAGQYTVQQILAPFDAEFSAANQAVLDLNTKINGRHGQTDANGNPLPDVTGSAEALATAQANAVPGVTDPGLQAATAAYQADLNAWSAAQTRLATANATRQNALQTAIDKDQVIPAQAEQARMAAAESKARADSIDQASQISAQLAPSQQALLVAQAGSNSAQALLDQANAAKATATTPADIQLATAQANQAQATADATNAMVDANKAKVQADTTLTQHQVGLTDNQSEYYKALGVEAGARADYESAQAAYQRALIPGAPGLQAAQTVQAAGAGAQAQATAQATLESIKQKQQGPVYGLADQVPLIQSVLQTVFHNPANVGKSSDELNSMADDLLKQYTTATLGGTTIGQAAAATATAQQNNYATQMGGVNALQNALASRANAYTQLGGTALGQMANMNMYAPRGSTAGAAAFNEVMDQMSQRLASQQFAPVQLPQAPALPTFLQAFAAGHQAGVQQGAQAGAAQAPSAQGQSPTINVNVNGQPAGGSTGGNALPAMLNNYANAAATPPMGPSFNPMAAIAPPSTSSGYSNPPSIMTPPATINPIGPQPSYVPAPVPTIPNLMQNYMGFANPMNMIGFRGA